MTVDHGLRAKDNGDYGIAILNQRAIIFAFHQHIFVGSTGGDILIDKFIRTTSRALRRNQIGQLAEHGIGGYGATVDQKRVGGNRSTQSSGLRCPTTVPTQNCAVTRVRSPFCLHQNASTTDIRCCAFRMIFLHLRPSQVWPRVCVNTPACANAFT